MITGKKLIELGYSPSRWFSEVIEYANTHQLVGQSLIDYIESVKPGVIEPHEAPQRYYKNIKAKNEIEKLNLNIVEKSMDIVMQTATAQIGTIMPDASPAGPIGTIPVGGVVVTKNAIHPAMHSADICCSVMLTNFGMIAPKLVLDMAHSITHFGGGGRKDNFELGASIVEQMKRNEFLNNEKSMTLAHTHLGTQGDGNHFLYVGRSNNTGETMMITHHGSRGLGAYLYSLGKKVAENFRQEISPKTPKHNAWIPYATKKGKSYWEALQIIRQWTKSNHEVLHRATYVGLGVDPINQFWNEHNFVFKENDLFYHAKGATPLLDQFVPDSFNGLRLIPLNMKEPVLIVRGERNAHNLGFAPHGAGRNMSRSQHKLNHAGKSINKIFAEETAGLDVRFYSKNIDISELPSAYKNAKNVKSQIEAFGLGEIVDEILPYGCIMAGDWRQNAPWKKKKR